MMQKNYHLLKRSALLSVLFIILVINTVSAQLYQHNFGTTTINSYPYTVAPNILHPDLSNSVWTNNKGSWVSFIGSTGVALGVSDASSNASLTLTFTIAPGKQLNLSTYSFWRQRTPSGPQNWTMAVNGINVGTGTIPGTGAGTGTLALTNPATALTGNVTILITLSNPPVGGFGSFRIDDFTLNGTITNSCTPPVISTMSPTYGPINTVVTVNGTGFQAGSGTSSVKFNGIEATSFTVLSATQIKAVVPAAATTGNITVTTDNCTATANSFTVTGSSCTAPGEIYISELYDQESGSGGVIEIYNPTSATINLTGYILQRYGNISDTTPSQTLALTGTIGSEMTYLISCSVPNQSICAAPTVYMGNLGPGFNANDKFEILKNGTLIDAVNVPFSNPGYTLIRKPNAVAPSTTYNINDWNNTQHPEDLPGVNLPNNYCQDLGNHVVDVVAGPVPAFTSPISKTVCENGSTTLTVAITPSAGYTFQWKILDNTGNWINITNGANYSGVTTATLSIANIPPSLNNAQYYCEMVSSSCALSSNTAQLTVLPLPAIPTVIAVQPTCTTATGSITVTAPLGAEFTYSRNGIDFQAATTFTNLAAGTYTINVKNTAGCTSVSTPIVLNPAQTAPAVPTLTITQPTCTTPTGTIAITAPTGTGLTYSRNGVDFQPETTFNNLPAGLYSITVKNAAGCTTVSAPVTINAAPATPAIATFTTTQPTCTTTTGSITITTPVGNDLSYSINGVDFQAGTAFTNVAPGSYTITVKNATGCTSVTASIIINTAPGAPAIPQVTAVQPTCATVTGTITVTNPEVGNTYSINGVDFSVGTSFTNLTNGIYTVTVKNTAGCSTVSQQVIINVAPTVPAIATYTVSQPNCTTPTGSITIDTPVAADITYSIDGINFQAQTLFANLAPDTYTVIVKNADGCTSETSSIVISSSNGAPQEPILTVIQPTCSTVIGTIAVNNTETGNTYSINGVDFLTETSFTNLNEGIYTITVKNAAGCTNISQLVTINPAPLTPVVATYNTIQPNCSTSTGNITIVTPTGSGLMYSLDGTNFQAAPLFANLNGGNYTVTVKNADGCTSVTQTIVINSALSAPVITTNQGCRDTAFGQNYVLEALPSNNSFDIATAFFEWKINGKSIGEDENIFNVTAYAADNNLSANDLPLQITLTVTASGGCESTTTYIVDGYFCNIPRGISPNNDGSNDSFDLAGLNVSKLSIFNRYGEKVYSQTNYMNQWKGQSDNGNELPTGTYYYVIEIADKKAETGWVYVNREQ